MPRHASNAGPVLYTIGHSTRTLEEFVELLKAHGVTMVVDVRTVPRSRRVPQFNIETLPGELAKVGIEHSAMASLGGLRKTTAESKNNGWRNASFRGYADHMQTPEFGGAIDELIAVASRRTCAIMCAEAVPWRCHRSLIGDAMVVRGWQVLDIMSARSAKPHRLTEFAKVRGMRITYPGE